MLNHEELEKLAKYYFNLLATMSAEIATAPFGTNLEMFDNFLDMVDKNAREVFNLINK